MTHKLAAPAIPPRTYLLRAWLSPPVIVLIAGLALFGALGAAGVGPWQQWPFPLRWATAAMFLLTASARLGPRRADVEAMVPPQLPRPALLVALTGVLEALGALGLLYPPTTPAAGWCLAALLVSVFPANVYAVRQGGSFAGRDATPLGVRSGQQAIYIACALISTF